MPASSFARPTTIGIAVRVSLTFTKSQVYAQSSIGASLGAYAFFVSRAITAPNLGYLVVSTAAFTGPYIVLISQEPPLESAFKRPYSPPVFIETGYSLIETQLEKSHLFVLVPDGIVAIPAFILVVFTPAVVPTPSVSVDETPSNIQLRTVSQGGVSVSDIIPPAVAT